MNASEAYILVIVERRILVQFRRRQNWIILIFIHLNNDSFKYFAIEIVHCEQTNNPNEKKNVSLRTNNSAASSQGASGAFKISVGLGFITRLTLCERGIASVKKDSSWFSSFDKPKITPATLKKR